MAVVTLVFDGPRACHRLDRPCPDGLIGAEGTAVALGRRRPVRPPGIVPTNDDRAVRGHQAGAAGVGSPGARARAQNPQRPRPVDPRLLLHEAPEPDPTRGHAHPQATANEDPRRERASPGEPPAEGDGRRVGRRGEAGQGGCRQPAERELRNGRNRAVVQPADAGWGAGSIETNRLPAEAWNLTVPAVRANSVSSPPFPTPAPGWTRVPRWRTMIEPAVTVCPAKLFTPSRLDAESRPFREEPPPFLCAMTTEGSRR